MSDPVSAPNGPGVQTLSQPPDATRADDAGDAREPGSSTPDAQRVAGGKWRTWRRAAVTLWVLLLIADVSVFGFPTDLYENVSLAILGLLAASVGRRKWWTVLLDWSLFAVALAVWQLSRGAADSLGRPTEWTWQIDFERALFGRSLNVWLQAHLKPARPAWWEVIVTLTYLSFFFLPYAVAMGAWLQSRQQFWRFVGRYVTMAMLSVGVFILVPSAPPWAAARCTAADVAHHPTTPYCMLHGSYQSGGLLGHVRPEHAGAVPHLQRISLRGLSLVHAQSAKKVILKGQETVNPVAALPSMHAAVSMLVPIYLWYRVRRRWRVLLAAYPLMMAFTLMYTAEHYLLDILAGWLLAAAVSVFFGRTERRRSAERSPGRHQRSWWRNVGSPL